ncbi:hypothetical protein GMA19_01243 [Paenibacillus polymyxa E681]|nr:hypothetical protein GE561_01243 [Paenibacillus polymyxa E681]QNV60922.1 hypothetical protein GMA19_01243 [Paenibacillus polymyxa E681]
MIRLESANGVNCDYLWIKNTLPPEERDRVFLVL